MSREAQGRRGLQKGNGQGGGEGHAPNGRWGCGCPHMIMAQGPSVPDRTGCSQPDVGCPGQKVDRVPDRVWNKEEKSTDPGLHEIGSVFKLQHYITGTYNIPVNCNTISCMPFKN